MDTYKRLIFLSCVKSYVVYPISSLRRLYTSFPRGQQMPDVNYDDLRHDPEG